jgi:O-succinylbenzoate synthase
VTLTVQRIGLREIRLPLREPFRISSGEVRERRILLLELSEWSGSSVWSECVAFSHPNYSPETIDTAWLALGEWIVPRVLGIPLSGPERVDELLARDIRGHRMARAALEMGVWALVICRRAHATGSVTS